MQYLTSLFQKPTPEQTIRKYFSEDYSKEKNLTIRKLIETFFIDVNLLIEIIKTKNLNVNFYKENIKNQTDVFRTFSLLFFILEMMKEEQQLDFIKLCDFAISENLFDIRKDYGYSLVGYSSLLYLTIKKNFNMVTEHIIKNYDVNYEKFVISTNGTDENIEEFLFFHNSNFYFSVVETLLKNNKFLIEREIRFYIHTIEFAVERYQVLTDFEKLEFLSKKFNISKSS